MTMLSDGEIVYQGPTGDALEYFESIGEFWYVIHLCFGAFLMTVKNILQPRPARGSTRLS
jgi:hypothetical protein